MTPHIQTQSEKDNDRLTVERITAQTDEAIAYVHAKDGCPYLDTAEVCPVGCDDQNMALDPSAFFFNA